MNNVQNSTQYYSGMCPQTVVAAQPKNYLSAQQGMPCLPPGMPTGPTVSQIPMSHGVSNSIQGGTIAPGTTWVTGAAPQTVMDIQYTQGYLRSQIGRRIKAEFLIGTNLFIDREGILLDVGASYILIRETDTDDIVLADIYSIKFVKFYY